MERRVDNKVERYWKGSDQKVFEEHGPVKIYCKEFATADGKEKFGWAYDIDSGLINNATTKQRGKNPVLRDEDDTPLMYYIKDGRFYIGWLNSNGYTTNFVEVHVFYDFDEKDGYNLYFMFAYACAVNDLLTYNNSIDFHTDANYDYYWADSPSDYDVSFNVKNFPEDVEYSSGRLENGSIDGDLVWIDGKWRNIINTTYIDKNGVVWRAFKDSIGYHVQTTRDSNRKNWYEPMVLFPEYRTIRLSLIKDQSTNSSIVAGKKIADVLKKGLYKSRWRQNNNIGYLGRMSINEGVITCWFDELDEKAHDLLIDYKTVSVKRN